MADSGPAIVGEVVNGRYEILERLGQGTYFEVFKARDRIQNRLVALKLLRSDLKNLPYLRDRLAKEVVALTELIHPSIARVYEAGLTDRSAYLVTEYVRGMTLKERIQRAAPLPMAVAVDIAIAVTESLEFAHDRGVTHGDLRSHNVLITAEGQVKVTDFGVSAILAASHEGGAPPVQVAHYMSPEATEGMPATPSTDIYALGVILYEMLTGVLPFEGETAFSVALKIAKDQPPLPSRINAGIPTALDGVALKCLQKEPSRRYRSAQSLLRDLQSAQDSIRFGRSLDWSPSDNGGKAGRKKEVVPEEEAELEEVSPSLLIMSTLSRVALAIMGIGVIVVGYLFWNFFLRTVPDVKVPDVAGLDRSSAVQRLEKMNLVAHVNEDWSSDVPKDQVIKTYPNAGASVKAGNDVSVWVSKGPEMVRVPDVTHMASQKAVDALREAHLKVGSVSQEFSDSAEKYSITGQIPEPDQMVPPGTKVNLVKSMGPEPMEDVNPPTPPDTTPETPPAPETTAPETTTPETTPTTTPNPSGGAQRRFKVDVDVPEGSDPQQIQIEVSDDNGTNVRYIGTHHPGEKFSRIVTGVGDRVVIRVYSDGQVLSEKVMDRGNG